MTNDINVVLGSGSSLFWASSRRFWSRSCVSSQVLSRQKISSSDFSSLFRKFPVGTSIVSRRSSRSYSHQSFYQVYFDILLDICKINLIQATPRGTFGYSTQQYSKSDHFYTARSSITGSIKYSISDYLITFMCCRHLRYYQPNVYHYHSTPWRYR